MKGWHIFLMVIMMNNVTLLAETESTQELSLKSEDTLPFYPTHYWQALVAMAKHDNDRAERIMQQGVSNEHPTPYQEYTIDQVFDHIFITLVAYDPQLLSSLGLFEARGINKHNEYLTDLSAQELCNSLERKKDCLKLLYNHPIDVLTPEQQISYKIFEYMLTNAVAGEKFLFHEYRVNHLFGFLFELITTFTQYHRLVTEEDAQRYCTRLTAIPLQCKQAIEMQNHQKNRGIIPPEFTIQRVVRFIDSMMPADREDALLYKHLVFAVGDNPCIDKNVLQQAYVLMGAQVYPALQELRNYYQQFLYECTTNNGVWALPDGDAYYAYVLERSTTSSLSADEIHELGLQEVERITHHMRTLFVQLGMHDERKTVGQLLQELAKQPEFYYPSTPEGRETCLREYEAILERCRAELHLLFDRKPKVPVIIKAVPQSLQDDMPAAYYLTPSLDGTRPGIFFANLRNMQEVPRYGMQTLVIHEAEPGHHFQLALQNEMAIAPARKLGEYTAYVEGWALYVEKLAYEQGFYTTPADQLGHLQDELLRAVRLVVDTGIHKKRWSKEYAIAYMMTTLGYHHNSVVTEVERYYVMPGQACAYKIGQLTILALRDKAKKALGDAFDIREFHNMVLETAAVPLSILEEAVDRYIHLKKM